MPRPRRLPLRSVGACLLAALLLPASAALAGGLCPGSRTGQDVGRSFFVSPLTHHWNFSPEHRQVGLLAVHLELPDDRFCGLSVFSNSFGQPSVYAFTGARRPQLLGSERLYGSISAGVIYGYVGRYRDKVPVNIGGFAPAVIPGLGFQKSARTSAEIHFLGKSAVMIGINMRL
jgi:hypothetical protein